MFPPVSLNIFFLKNVDDPEPEGKGEELHPASTRWAMLCARLWGTFPFLNGDGGGVDVDRVYGKGGENDRRGGRWNCLYVKWMKCLEKRKWWKQHLQGKKICIIFTKSSSLPK